MSLPRILYEDNHLLVIDKPSGLATMGVQPGTASAVNWAASYIKKKYCKPGNVFVGVVSRLDAAVSGILILARTSKAASRLSEQMRRRSVKKLYLAIVEGKLKSANLSPPGDFCEVVHYLRKNESRHKIEAVNKSSRGAQQAVLQLRVALERDKYSILEIDLITGRKHQIRAQLAALGVPVLGDEKYGAACRQTRTAGFSREIGLHCYRLSAKHPTKGEWMHFQSVPKHWSRFVGTWHSDLAELDLHASDGWKDH